jgi:hypothetical protein
MPYSFVMCGYIHAHIHVHVKVCTQRYARTHYGHVQEDARVGTHDSRSVHVASSYVCYMRAEVYLYTNNAHALVKALYLLLLTYT